MSNLPAMREEMDPLLKQLVKLEDYALALHIVDNETYQYAIDMLDKVSDLHKLLESVSERFREPVYRAYVEVREEKQKVLASAEMAIEVLRKKLSEYVVLQEQLFQDELDKRLEDKKKETEERLMEEVAAAVEKGDTERAEKLFDVLEKRSYTIDIELPHGPDTPDHVTYREYWTAEIAEPYSKSIKELCGAIAEGRAPVDLIKLNQKVANEIARSLKDEMNVPGLRVIRKKSLVRKSK